MSKVQYLFAPRVTLVDKLLIDALQQAPTGSTASAIIKKLKCAGCDGQGQVPWVTDPESPMPCALCSGAGALYHAYAL